MGGMGKTSSESPCLLWPLPYRYQLSTGISIREAPLYFITLRLFLFKKHFFFACLALIAQQTVTVSILSKESQNHKMS